MTKEIKGFITRDDFSTSENLTLSPIYRLSEIGFTYSKNKLQYYSLSDPTHQLYVFKIKEATGLDQSDVDGIINVVKKFSAFLTTSQVTNKQQAIILFLNNYNVENPTKQVSNFNYKTIISYNNIKTVDYLTFSYNDISCNLWLSDSVFKVFYPDYDISVVLPFANFQSIVTNTTEFIKALDNFDLIEMNRRTDVDKNDIPCTATVTLNIPYLVPSTTLTKNCYFNFNIYGSQGNYEYILKLELYRKLTQDLGLDPTFVQTVFPTILNINEFFITPRWDKMAIPSQVGQFGINSQISLTYTEKFDLTKFIKIFNSENFLKENTYSVPFDYNNILLNVTNGFYNEADIKDFKRYYSDLITISSTHPDFARMSQKTQRFITLLENMLDIGNSDSSTELFNKILQNKDYHFTIISRGEVNYLSFFFDKHQYYLLPKYEFIQNL